ncbi:MFS transporter [Arthrobacter ginkgonis]|uniref:MFS transporter n=1 Tax=Arthrobacter ginkgonis TaxID=1630594 RepID=UPI0031E7DF25
MAIPILAVQQMDDVGLGGALVAVSLGPSVLAAPFVGAALDRTRHPGILIAGSGFLTAVAFAVTAFLGQIALPVVFVFLALAGAVAPFYLGGLSSFVAEAIPDQRRAFAYDALSYNMSAVAGPALVAVTALFFPAQAALGGLAVAAVLGALSTVAIGLRSHGAAGVSVGRSVIDGLGHILGHRPLAVVTGASTLSQVGQGGLAVAAVALSLERTGAPSDGALLVTSFAIGSLVGALCETVRPTRARPPAVMMVGFFVTGLFTVAAALDLGTAWTVVAIGLSGVFTASATTAMLHLRNHLSPPRLKSQVFTVGAGLRTSAAAAGAALAGSMTGPNGGLTVAGIGLIWVVSAGLMIAYPAIAKNSEQLPVDSNRLDA